MSYYVHRLQGERHGWVGPIRSRLQAGRERQAWADAGWTSTVWPSSVDVRGRVRAWERQVAADRAARQ